MLNAIARWEAARLVRSSPGTRSLCLLLCLTLLHLLPWRSTEFFENPFQAAVMLSSLFALVVTCAIGRDAGAVRRGSFWLYQKGVPQLDYALNAFLFTFAVILAFIAAGIAMLSLGLMLNDEAIARTVAVVAVVSVLTALVVHALVFLLASLGVARTTEAALLFVFLALTADPVLLRASTALRRAAHWLLPPVSDAFQATSALFSRDWHAALGHSTHVLAFLLSALAAACMLQARLRPSRGPQREA